MRRPFLLCLLSVGLCACTSAWQQAGFTDETARSWKTTGLPPEEARQWQVAGFTETTWKEWRDTGFQADEAQAWSSVDVGGKQFDGLTAREWRTAGFGPFVAAAWRKGGFTSAEAKDWQSDGFGFVAEEARQLGSVNVSGEPFGGPAVRWWRTSGVDPTAATEWRKAGFSSAEAKDWRAAGHTSQQAVQLRASGLTPSQALQSDSEETDLWKAVEKAREAARLAELQKRTAVLRGSIIEMMRKAAAEALAKMAFAAAMDDAVKHQTRSTERASKQAELSQYVGTVEMPALARFLRLCSCAEDLGFSGEAIRDSAIENGFVGFFDFVQRPGGCYYNLFVLTQAEDPSARVAVRRALLDVPPECFGARK